MVGKNTARGFSLANRPKANIDPAKQGPYNTKMKYPGKEAYTFSHGPSHTSPCMSLYWLHMPIRQGKKILDTEHDEKPDEEAEETEEN